MNASGKYTPGKYTKSPATLRLYGLLALLSLAIIASYFSEGITATPSHTLRTGVFLVAANNLTGSSFDQTVILLTRYGNNGTLGLVINRPSHIPLSEAFPSIRPALPPPHPDDSLFLGGPMHTSAIFVLTRTRQVPGMTPIFDDVLLGVGDKTLLRVLQKQRPGEVFRAYAGYSGWSPGQLEAEVERGDWLIVEADSGLIFDEQPDQVWNRLTRVWSGRWI